MKAFFNEYDIPLILFLIFIIRAVFRNITQANIDKRTKQKHKFWNYFQYYLFPIAIALSIIVSLIIKLNISYLVCSVGVVIGAIILIVKLIIKGIKKGKA